MKKLDRLNIFWHPLPSLNSSITSTIAWIKQMNELAGISMVKGALDNQLTIINKETLELHLNLKYNPPPSHIDIVLDLSKSFEGRSWTEDSTQYENICLSCKLPFLGHKYRRVCKKCIKD